jgi:hypothetical protein
MDKGTVVLIGDSVLDNFYWLQDKEKDLKYRLIELGYNTINLAVDESRVNDIIFGIKPREVYSIARLYPYPCSDDGKVYPIKQLYEINTDLAVISMGGNDFRVNLLKIIKGVDWFINSVITSEFVENLKYVISNVKLGVNKGKVILICVYFPYLGIRSPYQALSPFKDKIYNKLFEIFTQIAHEYNIPILDLSRTFDPYNRSHYGTTEIEPSDLSNKCIAQCINYIANNYRGYKVYYAPDCDINNIICA